MNLNDAENKLYNSEEITKPVKLFTLSEADKMNKYTFKPFDYDVRSDFSKGVSVGVGELTDIPQEVVLFGKRARLALGGYFGDTPEEFENKRVNLITAERNLLEAKQNRMLENKVSLEASESLSFSIGSNIPTFATMLLGAGAAYRGVRAISTAEKAISAAGKIGLAENFLFEGASEVAKKTPTVSKTDERIKTGEARAGELDVDKITKEWAAKSTLDVPLYAAVSTYLEAKAGFGEQLNIWNTPIKLSGTTKNIVARALAKTGITATSEGTTETLQSLSSTGINLIDGTITPKDLPEELQEAVMSGIVGGIMGTASGGSVSLKQARNAISMIRQQVEPVVGKENAQTVAESLFNDASTDLSNIVTRELEIDSQLRNKHGNIWNSMLAAVSRAIEGKPRFEGWSEDQKAHYVNTVAKHFADNALAEANFRGVTLDGILRASDITYDKGIRIKRHINLFDALKNPEMIPPETKLKRESLLAFLKRNGGLQDYGGELKSRDAQKLYPGIVSKNGMNFDDAALMAWENGYFPSKTERPDINEFLEAVDEGLRGNHRYNTEEERNFSDAIEDLREELDRLGIDYKNMTAAEIEKAVDEIPELKSLEREAAFYEQYEPEIGLSEDEAERFAMETEGKQYPVIEDKDLPEYYQIADENAKLDAENPAYNGETITINGKERTVYNSNGERIAQSKEALENFYKWFGDSKVVDEQGRPLVVYHGSENKFDTFDIKKIGKYGEAIGHGFYFAEKGIAERYNKGYLYPVYLRMENPVDYLDSNKIKKRQIEDIADWFNDNYIENEDSHRLFVDNLDYTFKGRKIDSYLISDMLDFAEYNEKDIDKDEVYQDIYKKIKEVTGIDGFIQKTDVGTTYVAFTPNQIKSTQNRGTYSESDNIYYQSAFHGTPFPELEGGSFKLEKIGTGENAQAHGYGLYYAASYDIADKRYRERLTKPYTWFISFGKVEYDKKSGKYKNAFNEKTLEFEVYKDFKLDANEDYDTLIKSYEQTKGFADNTEEKIKIAKKYKEYFINGDIHNFSDESMATGQVYEVDLPENPYLLDEQKTFAEQSDFVKQQLMLVWDNLVIDDAKIVNLTGSKTNPYKNVARHKTGKEIYKDLANILGSDKAASELLEKNGIKGITYDGRQDGQCFVIFNPKDVKVIQKFYQRGKNAQGSTKITPDEYIIKLLEGADESTLAHEFAHYWLTEMWNYTKTGRASENYMKRWNTIADYLGVKPEQTRLTPTQQEKFASSYEAYLTRGELPTPLIASAFDDYDKWLQQVYKDYNSINYHVKKGKKVYSHPVRLTDAAIKFFQSMTTGTLEAPALAPKNTGVEVPQTVSAEEVIEPTNEIIEAPTTYDTTRVINITEGEKGVSKVFQREAMKHADRIVDELGVSYNKINLEEQAVKASEWVQNNLEEARKVVNGAPAPEGIIDTAIFIAYENEMLRIGNNAEYQRALKIHSQVQTQRGQAIAAERITTDDVYNPAYWWKKLQKSQETNVARKLFKGDTDALNKVVETETKNLMKQIAGKPKDEQAKALSKLAEKLQKDYNLDTLYQMPDEVNERTVREFIKDTIGVNPDVMAGNEVINKAEQLQKLWENTKDSSGNPSVEAMRAKRELNDLIQAQNPSSTLAIWTSIFGRGVMLASVKSPVLNIISNIEAGLTEGITRRIMYKTTEKAVDANVKKEFSNYAWEVYKASGDIVSTMNDYDDDMRIIGEQILHSQGPGAFRAASRKVEEVSFKYLMGAPDAVAKTLAFNDTADLLATKIAKEEGAKDISARATEIYKDAILIKPETEVGQKVREQAQAQAHYTTFTNDSWAARFGLSARNWLNMVGRNKIRLGDLTMKFVKTPANVQMMGLEYGFGSLYTLYNIQEVIKNPQSEVSQHAIRAAVRNGLGIALAALLYSMLDPEDYFSEFDTLNPKEKDKMRALGALPNSIKIGNRWVSLDYFGQLGIPLVGMLEARRNNGLRSYIQSGLTQAAKIPGIKETKQLIDTMSEYARYDLKPEKIVQMMAGTVLDQARAMTIPAIVNDIAKMTDDYERDTMGGVFDKVFASIPGLRQTLPERYGVQGIVETEPALSTLLFGSRVKTAQDNKLVREINKLSTKDEQPSISDVTKYGDLRLLSPEKKVRVRKEFYKLYNSESKKLISTREYQKKSPEDKKKALNKVRSRVVKSLKEKYSNDIQREKRRQ